MQFYYYLGINKGNNSIYFIELKISIYKKCLDAWHILSAW